MDMMREAIEKRARRRWLPKTVVHSSKGRFDVTMVEPGRFVIDVEIPDSLLAFDV